MARKESASKDLKDEAMPAEVRVESDSIKQRKSTYQRRLVKDDYQEQEQGQ